ncbi:PH domain-containing protein [Phthorimaea operculella]|nr:PH domain-containing protein [Phthorimaea operculella]
MSGYLEVKYPLKTNLPLNPFKSWKRQWVILRPSATMSGGSLAVYCSEAGATAGSIDLPSGSVVRRAKSRSRPYAFAVFPVDERKPRVLLAAQSLHEAHSWMDKIKALLNGDNLIGTETLLKDCFSVTIIPTDLSSKMGLYGDGTLSVSPSGVQLARTHNAVLVQWQHIRDVALNTEDKDKICVLTVDSEYRGGGELKLSSPAARDIYTAVQSRRHPVKKFSKSDGDLRNCSDIEVRRSSWYSGPSEVSLDDLDLIMSKESTLLPVGQLSRCMGAGELSQVSRPRLHTVPATSFDDSMSDRRSLLSVASGIYEEIPDLPASEPAKEHTNATYCKMGRDVPDGVLKNVEVAIRLEEPTYESVADCVYATMRRSGKRYPPPPLPPRLPFGTSKLNESWNARLNPDESAVTRHNSLGSLPRGYSRSDSISRSNQDSSRTATLPYPKSRSFSVFRKRLKSDSRIATSPKSDTSKENKDIETKKKKFDFTPKRDIFKNFKVSRKIKNLKITSTLTKGETKSCEFLDETEHVTTNRCSKSVECLEDEFLDEFDGDLSIEFNDDAVAALALPQEIVDLILRSREQINKVRLKESQESDYLPMSPITPQQPLAPIEHHYIVMSPKTNLA